MGPAPGEKRGLPASQTHALVNLPHSSTAPSYTPARSCNELAHRAAQQHEGGGAQGDARPHEVDAGRATHRGSEQEGRGEQQGGWQGPRPMGALGRPQPDRQPSREHRVRQSARCDGPGAREPGGGESEQESLLRVAGGQGVRQGRVDASRATSGGANPNPSRRPSPCPRSNPSPNPDASPHSSPHPHPRQVEGEIPTSPYISLHLPTSPYISPISPYTSPNQVEGEIQGLEAQVRQLTESLTDSATNPNPNPNPNPI